MPQDSEQVGTDMLCMWKLLHCGALQPLQLDASGTGDTLKLLAYMTTHFSHLSQLYPQLTFLFL